MASSPSSFPLGFSTLACPTWTLRQIIEAAAANGYGGVDFRGLGDEIDITNLPVFTTEIDATICFFREFGLEMPCLNTSVTLVSPSPQRWQEMLDECHRYALLAEKTGSRMLRIFGGAVPTGMTRDEALTVARRHLRQVIKICRSSGCQPIVETHDAWTCVTELMELLRESTPGEVGVLWDTEHTFRAGEAPQDTAMSLARFIVHVHVKDSILVDGRNHPCLMGEGDIPIAEFLQSLRSIGYTGYCVLETEKRWHSSAPEPEESIPQFADYLRAINVHRSAESTDRAPTSERRPLIQRYQQ